MSTAQFGFSRVSVQTFSDGSSKIQIGNLNGIATKKSPSPPFVAPPQPQRIKKEKEKPRCSVPGCTEYPTPPSSTYCAKCQKECITTVNDPRIKITDLGNGRKHAYFGYQIWVKEDEDGEALQDLMDSCHKGGSKIQEPYGLCSDRGFNFKMTGWNVQ